MLQIRWCSCHPSSSSHSILSRIALRLSSLLGRSGKRRSSMRKVEKIFACIRIRINALKYNIQQQIAFGVNWNCFKFRLVRHGLLLDPTTSELTRISSTSFNPRSSAYKRWPHSPNISTILTYCVEYTDEWTRALLSHSSHLLIFLFDLSWNRFVPFVF